VSGLLSVLVSKHPVLILLGCEIRYLLQNMDWLEEELGGFDDDYLVFDCPGKSSVMP
jgi:hypothetical protein